MRCSRGWSSDVCSSDLIVRDGSEDVVGEFNRKFRLLDRYVLDLKADGARTLDRRVALALGVMLDTGERRGGASGESRSASPPTFSLRGPPPHATSGAGCRLPRPSFSCSSPRT